MRLIDADAFRKNIECCDIETSNDWYTIVEQLEEAPTVDAVILPCKVDDEVFINIAGTLFPFMVISINIHTGTPIFKAQHGINLVWVFGSYDVGKTVFLTREEAEAALAKMGGEKDV